MPDLFQNKSDSSQAGFDPIALYGQFVTLHINKDVQVRRVDFVETMPRFQVLDLGALGAGLTTAKTNLTNLDLFDDEFGQFRLWTLDNVQLRIYLYAGTLLHQLKNIQVPVSMLNVLNNPSLNLSEICVWEDNRPAVEAVNGSGVALNAVRIMAQGYRFHTEAVKGDKAKAIEMGTQPTTHVWCSGRA